MVGFVANADPNEPIRTDLDNELADARWYTHNMFSTLQLWTPFPYSRKTGLGGGGVPGFARVVSKGVHFCVGPC